MVTQLFVMLTGQIKSGRKSILVVQNFDFIVRDDLENNYQRLNIRASYCRVICTTLLPLAFLSFSGGSLFSRCSPPGSKS